MLIKMLENIGKKLHQKYCDHNMELEQCYPLDDYDSYRYRYLCKKCGAKETKTYLNQARLFK